MQKLLLLLLYTLCLFMCMVSEGDASNRCVALINDIRRAHYLYFGVDFPYAYSVAQAEVESNCRHDVVGTDAANSVGFAQITPIWLKRLKKEGISEIVTTSNHAKAQAFILKLQYDKSWCNTLFEMYQRYNGGELVTIELMRANSCNWEDGYRVCKRKDVCVWYDRKTNKCIQYRNACDINYEYSLKIFNLAIKYSIIDTVSYQFW